jgi:hypothetical protein
MLRYAMDPLRFVLLLGVLPHDVGVILLVMATLSSFSSSR